MSTETETETAAAVVEAPSVETPAVATIDPDYSGPILPGTIGDQAAYDAAVAEGRLIELSPLDAAVNGAARAVPAPGAALGLTAEETEAQISLLVSQNKRKEATIANLQAELDAARHTIATSQAAELRALEVARVAPLNSAAIEAFAQGVSRAHGEEPQPARKRRRPFRLELDKRQDGPASFLASAIGTLGLPRIWARVAAAVVPAASVAARELVQSLDDDSPGGARITRDELEEIAELAASRLKRELLEEFIRG